MARGVNKVVLIGNLGQDPTSRFTADGMAVTSFSLATSETWKDKKTDEMRSNVEWHKVVTYKKAADIAAEYLRKGSLVYIEGKLRTSKWTDEKTGNERMSTEIVCTEMQMLGGKNSTPKEGEESPRWTPTGSQGEEENINDDDIPF